MEIVKESLILERKGVKPTANRILVLRTMLAASHPISLRELVMLLETMDKSSIFRVLNIFSVHHIVQLKTAAELSNMKSAAVKSFAQSMICTPTFTAKFATKLSASRIFIFRKSNCRKDSSWIPLIIW